MLYYKFLVNPNPFVSLRYLHLGGYSYLNLSTLTTETLFPNFIVMGAQRCGTTTLHQLLGKHEDIFASMPRKETGIFFTYGDNPWKAHLNRQQVRFRNATDLMRNYMLRGYRSEKMFGDFSTYYTMGCCSRKYKLAGQIRKLAPTMKFIYSLRDPYKRLESHFLVGGRAYRYKNINDFINAEEDAILNGLYYYQLSEFLRHFPKNQFKLVVFEELLSNPEKVLDEITDFLDVKRFTKHPTLRVTNNSTERDSVELSRLALDTDNEARCIKQFHNDIVALQEIFEIDTKRWISAAG